MANDGSQSFRTQILLDGELFQAQSQNYEIGSTAKPAVHLYGGINMRYSIKPVLSLVLGLITSAFILDRAGFDYNLFRSSFDLWKVSIRLGIPVGCVMIWFLILQGIPKSRSK